MKTDGNRYAIYKRKGGNVYYCQFKRPDGTWNNAVSTGQTSETAAETWAQEKLIERGGVFADGRKVLFKDFVKNFFNYNGRWAKEKRMGLGVSESHCMQRGIILEKHLLPYFGNMQIRNISKRHIKDFRMVLYDKGYSGNTINKCLSALKSILEMAEDQELISGIPRIDRVADRPIQKGILTAEEVKKLFSFQWMSKPSYRHPSKPLFVEQAGNRLAIITGIRLSELQGLLIKDVKLPECYITVKRAWDNYTHELKDSTKTKRERTIFFPKTEKNMIIELIESNPHGKNNPNLFLFYSNKYPNKPKDKRAFRKTFYEALYEIGISEEERKERNITFHSHRHFLNSLFINNKIPLQKVQQTLGHNTMQMSALYYHSDDMQDVVKIQKSIF